MLIKSANDKSKRVALLQDFQQSPMLPRPQFQKPRHHWLKGSFAPDAVRRSTFPKANFAGTTPSALAGCSFTGSTKGCLREADASSGG